MSLQRGVHPVNYLHSLSLRFNGHFPGEPGLASTRMSPLWILLELRVIEGVVTTGATIHAKLQSNHHHQQTKTQRFTGKISFLLPSQQCQSTEGNNHLHWYWLSKQREHTHSFVQSTCSTTSASHYQNVTTFWILLQQEMAEAVW